MAPLHGDDVDRLFWAADDRRIWQFHPTFDIRTPTDLRAWHAEAEDGRAAGHQEPFVIVDPALDLLIGSSRLMRIDRAAGACEIGATWLGAGYWGTVTNTAAKRWLLEHAFADAGRERVYFNIDVRNRRSIDAVRRLGAALDAVLRNDRRCHDGHRRATAVFSITRSRWPSIRAGLDERIGRMTAEADHPEKIRRAASAGWVSVVPVAAPQTHDLRHEVLRPNEPRTVVDYAEDRSLPCLHLAAIVLGRCTGVLSLYEDPAPAAAGPAHAESADWRIRGMAVTPTLQRLGIGTALLRAAVRWAARSGLERLWCNAREGSDRFYGAHGFEAVGAAVTLDTGHVHRRMARLVTAERRP